MRVLQCFCHPMGCDAPLLFLPWWYVRETKAKASVDNTVNQQRSHNHSSKRFLTLTLHRAAGQQLPALHRGELGALYTPPPIPTRLLLDSQTPTGLPDSYWTPRLLLDFTRTPANFILADHHTNLVSQSYWSPSKFLLESLGIADS